MGLILIIISLGIFLWILRNAQDLPDKNGLDFVVSSFSQIYCVLLHFFSNPQAELPSSTCSPLTHTQSHSFICGENIFLDTTEVGTPTSRNSTMFLVLLSLSKFSPFQLKWKVDYSHILVWI